MSVTTGAVHHAAGELLADAEEIVVDLGVVVDDAGDEELRVAEREVLRDQRGVVGGAVLIEQPHLLTDAGLAERVHQHVDTVARPTGTGPCAR